NRKRFRWPAAESCGLEGDVARDWIEQILRAVHHDQLLAWRCGGVVDRIDLVTVAVNIIHRAVRVRRRAEVTEIGLKFSLRREAAHVNPKLARIRIGAGGKLKTIGRSGDEHAGGGAVRHWRWSAVGPRKYRIVVRIVLNRVGS